MTVPPVADVPIERLAADRTFAESVDPGDLVFFLLNVGDGDTQLVLLPETPAGVRRAIVVDVATTEKLPWLLDALAGAGLLREPPAGSRLFELVVATHPHEDHIGGMPEFLERYGHLVDEFWEPGYFHTAPSYAETMRVLEDLENAGHGVRHSQPTSGLTRYVGQVQVTVLTPAIGLRNRFDTYGIEINNASIALRLAFPASRVVQEEGERRYVRTNQRRIILGADAQTVSWAHAMADFPELHTDRSPAARTLRMALGSDPLRADVFKIPHHMSKHGVSLELVELVDPSFSLVSSVAGSGKYNFPHAVAQEAVREALQATSSGRAERKADLDLGIHYTGGTDSEGAVLGSIALVMAPAGRKRELWRLGDEPGKRIDLTNARRVLDPARQT